MTTKQKTLDLRWLWLGVPLAVASLGWATVPHLAHAASGMELEGAYYLAAFAGLASTALTAPVTSIVLAAIQRRSPLSLAVYVTIVLAVAVPALVFEALVPSASVMPVFVSKGTRRMSHGASHVWYAATFLALYSAIGVVTYPFSRRGVFAATLAAMTTAVAIVGFVAYRVMVAH